jgi:hypothetical protein
MVGLLPVLMKYWTLNCEYPYWKAYSIIKRTRNSSMFCIVLTFATWIPRQSTIYTPQHHWGKSSDICFPPKPLMSRSKRNRSK